MKSRVISVRVRLDLLVACYHILELSGLPSKGLAQSRAVSGALERIYASLAHEKKLPVYMTESEVEAKLAEFSDPNTWPGVTVEDSINISVAKPVLEVSSEARKAKLNALIEKSIEETESEEQQKLADCVRGSSLYRDQAEDGDIQELLHQAASIPPWESSSKVDEELVLADRLYISAKDNELLKLAIRTAYKALSMELWSTDTALKLSNEVYKMFKSYEKLYLEGEP